MVTEDRRLTISHTFFVNILNGGEWSNLYPLCFCFLGLDLKFCRFEDPFNASIFTVNYMILLCAKIDA